MENTNVKKVREDAFLSKRGNIIFLLLFVVIILMSAMCFARHSHRLSRAQVATVECTVVDKYHDDQGIHGFAYAYHLELLLDAEAGSKETIAVSKRAFNAMAIGDELLCSIIYDNKGVIDIRVSDTAIDQYTESERHKDYFLAITIILFGYTIVGIALTLKTILKERK